jgi:drug/metabolite transporter (DMT)-like permease
LTVLALAPLILNEHMTWLQLAGAGLVLSAITILPILESQKRG